MKSRLLPILLTCACASLARADFNPVTLTANSYTYDIVVESNTVAALPYCIDATSGSGTSKGDNTYYEQGLHSRPGVAGWNSGIPVHNTVFTNINNANMMFLMPPDYTTNNTLQLDSGLTTGTFTFNTPTYATNLAILSGGAGAGTVNYTVTHSDGSTETGSISLLDWFSGGSSVAWGCNGRITSGGGYNNYNSSSVNNNNPYLYGYQIKVSGTLAVSNIVFTFSSGNEQNFYAVSGKNVGSSTWNPIPLGGFNRRTTVPATVPFPVNATMDQGTNIAQAGNGMNTWFEQGYVNDTPTDAAYGLPPSGSIFNSQSQPTHHYQMGNYSANNAILIDVNHLVANITPAVKTNLFSSFALLTAGGNIGGNNVMTNICILQHQDGINETNLFYGYDWYNSVIAPAFIANGRVDMQGRSANTVGGGNPKFFESFFVLSDVGSPVTNIVVMFKAAPATSSTTFIMAVSASAGGVPPLVTAGALPATQTWFPTQSANFSVQVSGTAPLTNTWLVQQGVDINSNPLYVPLTNGIDANGATVSGAGTTTLTINNLTLADGTNYEYIAANAFGTATSSPAILVMNAGTPVAPIIDAQAPTASFSALTNHTSTFSVTIDTSSAPPLFYQWYSGAAAISGATNATYVNVNINSTTFTCIITNFVGAATSSPVSVTIYSKPALSTYQSAIFALNPVSYWPLNEADGNTAYDYASTNDGTYTGNFTLGNTGLPATAGLGTNTSAGFDGSTAYVNIPVHNLNITGPMTVIEWVQPPVGADTGFTTPLGHSDSSYRFDVAGGQPHWADAGPDVVSATTINDGNWHQLVGVYDGTTQRLYVDGQPAGTPQTGAPAGNTGNVWIGGAPDYAGARNFNGNIAQVAIISSALSAAQVLAIYQSLDTPPTVSITPASPSIYAGSSITLTAHTNTSVTPATSLQWYYIDPLNNSNNIAGATGSTYTIANAPLSLNGYTYGVNAGNAYGSTTASVVLTVQNGPAYLGGDISPLTGEAYVGAPVTYTVNAQGSLPIYYQWSVDGIGVSGATNASFTLPAPCGTHLIQASFTNAQNGGIPVLSSAASLQGDTYPTNITFNTDGTGWQLNGGVPTIAANILQLTDGNSDEAVSAFYTVPQYVGSFTASFTYTASGNRAADGATFAIQNYSAGATSLGGGGGQLGYAGIGNSLALEINLYTGNGENSGIAAGTNGNTFATGGAQYQAPGLVDVTSGDPINFTVNWANGIMAVTATDATTMATYSTNYVYGSLTPILGGTDLGFVGFTGADGGATSIQTISNFQFNSVIPPVTLSASPVTGSSFVISWPAADPSYVLQKTSSLKSPSWAAGPTPVVVGGVNQATVNVNGGSGQQFYRLVRVVCQ